MEHDLEQQIAKLLLQVAQVAAFTSVRDFVRFFDRIRSNRLEALLPIPFAAALRIAELRHDGADAINRGHVSQAIFFRR